MGKKLSKLKHRFIDKWFWKQKLRYGTVPKPDDPNEFAKGKMLFVEGEKDTVRVVNVKGNLADPKKFEINGKYLISILDFYCQLKEKRRPTADELEEWNSIELVQVDVPAPKKETLH